MERESDSVKKDYTGDKVEKRGKYEAVEPREQFTVQKKTKPNPETKPQPKPENSRIAKGCTGAKMEKRGKYEPEEP